MIIREFIILITSKFAGIGFDQAERAADELADSTDTATEATKELGDAQKETGTEAGKAAVKTKKLAGETDKLAKSQKKAGEAAKKASTQARDASGRFGSASAKARGAGRGFAGFGDSLKSLAGPAKAGALALTGLLTVAGLGAGAIIKTGATFEGLRVQLTTLYGDAELAEQAFSGIKDFTKKTPFELEEVTQAFIALKNRGVSPTNDALTGLGDLASSRGRGLGDLVGAISAAARGELDPLEGFIDGARVSGDKLALSFKGQTVEVERNANAVTQALVAFGQMEGVQGGMAAQSATTAGIISNLKDGIATFFDEVAQLGVLDEFKALLADISKVGGDDSGGLAKILADTLIVVLRALREWIQQVTAEDIKGFFNSAKSAAEALAFVIGLLADAFRLITDASGGTEMALQNVALGVVALTAAFYGPAGLVVAAAAAGVAIGNLLNEMGASDALTNFLGDLTGLNKQLDYLDKLNGGRTGKRGVGPGGGFLGSDEERARLEKEAGFTQGTGLTGETVQIMRGGEKTLADIGTLTKIASGEIKHDALTQAEASSVLEQALAEDVAKNQERAFKRGRDTAATHGKKAKKGKKGNVQADPFDFAEQAEQASKTQAAEFAKQEFERLRFEGIAVEDALAQSRAAGKERAAELKKKFLDAGRIFDTTANNILDVLGLTGAGSVMEGRPPPQTLLITIAPVFKFIERFEQTNQFNGAGPDALKAATAGGGRAAVEQGMATYEAQIREITRASIALEADRLLKAGASGRLPQGVEG